MRAIFLSKIASVDGAYIFSFSPRYASNEAVDSIVFSVTKNSIVKLKDLIIKFMKSNERNSKKKHLRLFRILDSLSTLSTSKKMDPSLI